jgi:hypothetical protein
MAHLLETTMTYANASTHSRYYVFRHKTDVVDGKPVQTVETLMDGHYWSPAFSQAKLVDGITATQLANEASKMLGGSDGWTYCVGKVNVEVDGFFEIVVIR